MAFSRGTTPSISSTAATVILGGRLMPSLRLCAPHTLLPLQLRAPPMPFTVGMRRLVASMSFSTGFVPNLRRDELSCCTYTLDEAFALVLAEETRFRATSTGAGTALAT